MKTKFHGLLAVVALAGLSSVTAIADPLKCATVSSTDFVDGTTLSSFTSLASCTIGDTTFSNFTVYAASDLSLTDPSLGDFSMTIYVDPTLGSLDIADTGLTSPQEIHLTFQGTTGITGMTLGVGAAGMVTESIYSGACSASAGTCTGTKLNTTPLSASDGGTSSSAVTFAATDYFYKDISGGSSAYEEITPEPMTFSLIGGGLLGLGLLGRRLHQ